jgi:hypothetical protein
MKFLKQYNGFILERYNQLTKFYHVTSKDNLNSLLKGIDITLSKDRGQGSGFYVVTDLEAAENTKVTLGFGSPGFKVCDLLIEIESVLNTENFDIDYELVKDLPTVVKDLESKLVGKFRIFKISDHGYQFNIITKLSDEVSQDDFVVGMEELDGMGVFVPKCNIEIEFGFYPDNLDEFQDAQNVLYTTYYIDSLDRLGIKSLIEEEIFKKISNDGKVYALRYVGPKIRISRYKLKESGQWLDWIYV